MKTLIVSVLFLSSTFSVSAADLVTVLIDINLVGTSSADTCAQDICKIAGRDFTTDLTDIEDTCLYNQYTGVVNVALNAQDIGKIGNLVCVSGLEDPVSHKAYPRAGRSN